MLNEVLQWTVLLLIAFLMIGVLRQLSLSLRASAVSSRSWKRARHWKTVAEARAKGTPSSFGQWP